jgi:alkanesulfonate monooxygenase SsuD/methylene tetrahydromethanopterin reductase-like flavin-dependent oxidoreductase (luciferase family)
MISPRLGVMFDRAWDPAGIPDFAAAAEQAGADDLWVVEDLGWNGGLTAAGAALAATANLRVGLGIAPAPYRNPALFAMEAATLGRIFPGRFVPGLGHGVADWIESVGAAPGSTMALLEESIVAIRALLRGETVTARGREVRLAEIRLVHPPRQIPPVFAAAVRGRTLELAGRVAQGTIVAEGHGPAELPDILARVKGGGAAEDHELVVFTFARVGQDGADSPAGAELARMVEGQAEWLGRRPADLFTVTGSPAEAAEQVRSLARGGATTVILRLVGPDPLAQLAAVRSELT